MFKLELKRIFSKKINLLVIGAVMLLAIVFSGFAVSSTRYVDESGNVSESISSARKLDASKNQWRGTLTEATLVKVIQQNKDVFSSIPRMRSTPGTERCCSRWTTSETL